eukprot:860354-Prymnesium_polylepis.1
MGTARYVAVPEGGDPGQTITSVGRGAPINTRLASRARRSWPVARGTAMQPTAPRSAPATTAPAAHRKRRPPLRTNLKDGQASFDASRAKRRT